ncbi:DUF1990 domain-containing protein [Mycolicibacterium fortuitum]|uniref:DUF1990 domain-containing protein n=2 Tax=Mycolicibacterium fortuitum TaxID=1766 RepID=A0A0N9XRY6_MYCFO|nr:DUF1990 domain-containing protein [Mycolicibacterium fortuitum]ALI26589.1 hypothetical protein XA26_27540 [Mycolicibacterium fortuitum]MCA4726772.1 DUF1990 domain-containing protein [Mycolicibacterium fortuitum]MCV7140360.1 DUF1990 domain-containing protein [Mycolicibacterium fortuitum]MDV7191267.1 DUF1990 domain-containing protein [Mycolicibacterium fortuitum]MDV7205080.1 DUF1990 domain-containing protein [Mycolicibacterium fortuitum]
MKLHDLARLSLTYPDVGATAGDLPAGYHHTRASKVIGTGRDRFEQSGDAVLRWGMQHGAGLRVQATSEAAAVGTELIVRLGPVPAPCRVVYVLDETDRRGFAYGTLAGHPETGEELFSVRYDAATDEVRAEVVAFSRPATWWSRLGGPVTRLLQKVVTRRYLTGI